MKFEIGFFYALGAAIFWGIVYALDGRVVVSVPPPTILFMYGLSYVVLMLPVMLIEPRPLIELVTQNRGTLFYLGIATVCAVIANILIHSAMKRIGAPAASMIEIVYPMFVVIFSWWFFKIPVNTLSIGGGILIIAGVLLVMSASPAAK